MEIDKVKKFERTVLRVGTLFFAGVSFLGAQENYLRGDMLSVLNEGAMGVFAIGVLGVLMAKTAGRWREARKLK